MGSEERLPSRISKVLGLLHNSRQPHLYIAGLAQSKSLAQSEQLVSRLWLFSSSTLPHCTGGLAQSICVQSSSQLHCRTYIAAGSMRALHCLLAGAKAQVFYRQLPCFVGVLCLQNDLLANH